jgi:hypothetical protein
MSVVTFCDVETSRRGNQFSGLKNGSTSMSETSFSQQLPGKGFAECFLQTPYDHYLAQGVKFIRM